MIFGNFKVDLIVVGKLKEKALRDLFAEYEKRLKAYVNLNIIEINDISNKYDEKVVLEEENKLIMEKIDVNSYVIILDLNKKELTSTEFAKKLVDITTYDNSKITFIIGGSLGISDDIKNMANYSLTFSKMTFPHQLFRIMFVEQLYRAMRINNSEPYHK